MLPFSALLTSKHPCNR